MPDGFWLSTGEPSRIDQAVGRLRCRRNSSRYSSSAPRAQRARRPRLAHDFYGRLTSWCPERRLVDCLNVSIGAIEHAIAGIAPLELEEEVGLPSRTSSPRWRQQALAAGDNTMTLLIVDPACCCHRRIILLSSSTPTARPPPCPLRPASSITMRVTMVLYCLEPHHYGSVHFRGANQSAQWRKSGEARRCRSDRPSR